MLSLAKVFFTGMFISFLGALPLGSLNVSAMQIAIAENEKKAFKFSLGAALVEILYVRLSLKGVDWVMANQEIFYCLQWITVFVFLVMGISCFITAGKTTDDKKNILLNNKMNRFFLGFTMSALNPIQIPFWFIWSTYLLSNNVLLPTATNFNIYTLGIGIGTLLALGFFIFSGKWLVNKLKTSNRTINLLVALVFLISAIVQLYRVLYKPFL